MKWTDEQKAAIDTRNEEKMRQGVRPRASASFLCLEK